MTVANQVFKVIANGNDSATVFSFSPMELPDDTTQIVVTRTTALGVESTLVEENTATGYSVSVASFPGTGSVTYPASGGTPLATGETITMKRVLTLEQQLDLENQGGWLPETQERQFDRLVMIDLQQQEILDRSFALPVSDNSGASTEIPSPIADRILKWNSAGDALELGSIGSSDAVLPGSSTDNTLPRFDGTSGKQFQTSGVTVDDSDNLSANTLDATDTATTRTNLDVLQDVFTTQGDILYEGASAETRLAIGSSGQVLTTDGTNPSWDKVLPRSYLAGLAMSNAADTDHDITIAVGEAQDDGNAQSIELSSAITKQIDAVWALGTNAGGLDTGTVANDTWYHVFVIRRSDTGVVDALFSTSASSPTMPTNYDQKRRIGSVLTNGSANIIQFVQDGDHFQWTTVQDDVSSANNPGATATLRTLSVPSGVRVLADFILWINNADVSTSTDVWVSDPSQTDEAPTVTRRFNSQSGTFAGGVNRWAGHFQVRTNTSSQVRTRFGGSTDTDLTLNMYTRGWTDRRGRDD